jgi:hypothetical protein
MKRRIKRQEEIDEHILSKIRIQYHALPAQVRMELVYHYHAECRNSKLTSSW